MSISSDELDGILRQLIDLGFIRRDSHHGFVLANYFFQHWLRGTGINAEEAPLQSDIAARPPRAGLLTELKRRKVFRVAMAYLLVAWVLLQVGDIVFDFLEVPDWAGKLLLILLILGLPVALLLAWAYELTPDGIRREADVERRPD
jgi:hypothetical protein